MSAAPAERGAAFETEPTRPWALLGLLLLRSRLVLGLAVAMGLVGGASGAGLIAVIHGAQQGGRAAFGGHALALFVAVLGARLLSGLISRLLLVRMGQGVIRQLRTVLARHLLASSLAALEDLGAPRVMAMLTHDVAAVALLFANIPALCVDGAIVVGCLVYVGGVSPVLLALTLAVIALGVGVYRLLSGYALHRLSRARQTENALFAHLAGLTEGFKELKMDGGKATWFLSAGLDPTADEYRRQNMRAYHAYAVADLWGGLLFFLPLGLVLFAGLPGLTFEPAVGSAYVLIILFLIAPLTSVVTLLPVVSGALVSIRSIEAVRRRLPADQGAPAAHTALVRRDAWRELRLEGVRFAYAGDEGFALGPVDFVLRPGELVFAVGGNGSGKSTFVKVLCGLYTPQQGRIRVDGVALEAADGPAYRRSFSTIFSDFHMHADLPLAATEADERRAREYLELLRLDGLVSLRDGRFSRVDLSTGQRKRLAMVAALLEQRALLVLDEWAAEQDAESRRLFYESLLPELRARGTAVLVVTHDDRFFDCADRLVRFDYGRITYDGPAPGAGAGRAPEAAPATAGAGR